MNDSQKLKVLRAIDKLERLGPVAVLELLTIGRRDHSGDFCEGAKLGLEQACFVMASIGHSPEVICHRPETGQAIVAV